MKAKYYLRIVVLILCGAAPILDAQSVLRAGAATSNITPFLGTSLDGTISQNGPAIQIHDELHVRCLVLDDGEIRLAMVVCDSTMIDRSIYDHAKSLIEKNSGIPANRVLISATHSHATPRVVPGLTDNPLNVEYEPFLARRIADAVQRAVVNLAPAQVGWTSFEKPDFVFNRRWLMEPGSDMANPFGKSGDTVRMNPGREGLIKPAGPVDPEISVLSVQHLDGRPLALLANYSLHYIGGYQRGHVSADYFAVFANRIQELLMSDWEKRSAGSGLSAAPFVGIMSNGTSGDVNANDFSKPREEFAPWERMQKVAYAIADDVYQLYPHIKYQSNLTISMVQRELLIAVRKPSQRQIEWARELSKKRGVDPAKKLTRPQVYARETLALSKYPDEIPIVVQAIRIGDLAIASSPCETFAETGLAIKKRSPFDATFTIELANGADGYLPTPAQHRLGGYESWPARSSLLAVNAEPKIRNTILELLEELKKGN
ncbi:MAG: hypothetical protein O7C75_08430 [Verrucomicrobia bacterium]|nr:hypothetical protein [Verrucomicrobiota bacterium]